MFTVDHTGWLVNSRRMAQESVLDSSFTPTSIAPVDEQTDRVDALLEDSTGVLMAFSLPCCQSCTSISNLLSGVKPREVQGFPHSRLKRSPHARTPSTWLANGSRLEQRSTTGWRRSGSSCTRRFSAGDWTGPRTCSPRANARRARPERPAIVLTKIHRRARPIRGIPNNAYLQLHLQQLVGFPTAARLVGSGPIYCRLRYIKNL